MKVLFACGGTGGHIYPVIAIYQEFLAHNRLEDNQYVFVGADTGIDKDVFEKEGISNYKLIKMRNFTKSLSIGNIEAVYNNVYAFRQAKEIMDKEKPDLVIGMGNYSSFHMINEAVNQNIPFCIMENSVLPGLVTRMFHKKAKKVILSYHLTLKRIHAGTNVKVMGIPSRIPKTERSREEILKEYGLDPNKKVITVTSGSFGSPKINDAVRKLIKRNILPYQIIWVTGIADYQNMLDYGMRSTDKYKIIKYVDNMMDVLSITDLLVARAGKLTVQEIKSFKLPAVLIPNARAADNHQYLNAQGLKDLKVAEIITEKMISSDELAEVIDSFLGDQGRMKEIKDIYRRMNTDNCNEQIYFEIISDFVGDLDMKLT